ncbi:MAG: DUF4276 family protein [Actinomycetota bacterium]
MVKQIAFFIEGEEDPNDSRDEMKLRKTFHKVFNALDNSAKLRGIRLQFRLYKSRNATYQKFCEAVAANKRGVYPVLLVDSEDPVPHADPLGDPEVCWRHLRNRPDDRWERPVGVEDEQCQLMVQAIEAWLFADPEALALFYKQKFRKQGLPNTPNVEEIPKSKHLESLEIATKDTQKGRYHKVRHLSPLLASLDMTKVRKRAPFCDRIFVSLTRKIEG